MAQAGQQICCNERNLRVNDVRIKQRDMGWQKLQRSSSTTHHMTISLSGQTVLKIYQLYSMFLAERSLVQQSLKDAKAKPVDTIPRLEQVRNELFQTTASYLLLEIAISMRVLDDQFLGMSDNLPTCGILRPDVCAREKPLTFREACNKIIHGQRHQFQQEHQMSDSAKYRTERAPLFVYKPLVVYAGEKGQQKWDAYLEVIPFCDAAARLCDVALIK